MSGAGRSAVVAVGVGTVRVHDVESPLSALYRRYRPETFQEVIGQDHVTEPLRCGAGGQPRQPRLSVLRPARLRQDHLGPHPRPLAQLCAGPRSPTPAASATAAATSRAAAPGSIDVIEIDAASHGGVDDARDLREKALLGPVRDRYKVYIIDEAHMVTTQGFNALLKLVEEPPPHLRFIFATTEPDKVLPTIRSRTHHYPLPTDPAAGLLSDSCPSSPAREGRGDGARRPAARRACRRRVGA